MISVVITDPNIFLWVPTSVADAAAINPNGIKTLPANGFNTFCIKSNPVLRNGPKSLHKNPPGCTNLCNRVFGNFTLV